MDDMRNPLAKARDTWMESEEGKKCASGMASGQYLRNRLEMAFIAGADKSPDGLALAEMVVATYDEGPYHAHDEWFIPIVAAARALIAKAEGK